jgi:hypothetical protein
MASKTVTVGPGKTYASLQAAITGEVAANANLVTMNGVLNIELYAFTDTTQANVTGFTTDATRFVNIYTAVGDGHVGVWDSAKYNLSPSSNSTTAIIIASNYTRVAGIQVGVGSTTNYSAAFRGIEITAANYQVSGCIARCTIDPTYTVYAYGIYGPTAAGSGFIFNNIVYGFKTARVGVGGIVAQGSTAYVYDNTVTGCSNGIVQAAYRAAVLKNNLLYGNTVAITGGTSTTFTGSRNNSTDLAAWAGTYAGYTEDRLSQTFTFVDAANKDYRLTTSDTGAYQLGTDLSADTYLPFSTDITGTSRTIPWSIGAHQPVSGGGTEITGTGAASTAASTTSASGSLAITGTGTASFAASTASGAGDLGGAPITGTGAVSTTASTSSGSGALSIAGTGAPSSTAPTASGSGALAISGMASSSLAASVAAGSGSLSIAGTGAASLSAATASGAGALSISGTGAASFAASTAAGTGVLETVAPPENMVGTGAATFSASIASGSGALAISGTAAISSTQAVATGNGTLLISGIAVTTLSASEVAGEGSLGITGSGSVSLAPSEASGEGSLAITAIVGIAAVALAQYTVEGLGTLAISGVGTITFPAFTSRAYGAVGETELARDPDSTIMINLYTETSTVFVGLAHVDSSIMIVI